MTVHVMFQPEHAVETAADAASEAAEKFNAGEVIIEHVSNSSIDHPLIHLPTVLGIDFSVTKHVLHAVGRRGDRVPGRDVTVRRYLRQDRLVPTGFMNALESGRRVRPRRRSSSRTSASKWVNTWTPLLLTLVRLHPRRQPIGLIPIFDVLGAAQPHGAAAAEESFFAQVLHGGTTATGNFNVTAALATITFFAIIIAGARAHGFVQHWKNLVPHGLPLPVYDPAHPDRDHGHVRPAVRVDDATCGQHDRRPHRDSRDSVVRVHLHGAVRRGARRRRRRRVLSVPLAVGISALEIIVMLVQAYVFTLLSAVFIGMAIHAHH